MCDKYSRNKTGWAITSSGALCPVKDMHLEYLPRRFQQLPKLSMAGSLAPLTLFLVLTFTAGHSSLAKDCGLPIAMLTIGRQILEPRIEYNMARSDSPIPQTVRTLVGNTE